MIYESVNLKGVVYEPKQKFQLSCKDFSNVAPIFYKVQLNRIGNLFRVQ